MVDAHARNRWQRFLAYFRLSKRAVCEQSAGMGPFDYHDHPDDSDADYGVVHFYTYTCRRCGKGFQI